MYSVPIYDTGVAAATQHRCHGGPMSAAVSAAITAERVPRRTNAAATEADEVLKNLRQWFDNVWPFVALCVLAMSTQGVVGLYALGVVYMVALDRHFRGFVAAETSPVSRVCIALVCAKTSADMSTFNGDATPLHMLFKPIPDQTSHADVVWMVLGKFTTGNVAEMFKVTILCTRGLVDELPPLPISEPVKEPSTDACPKKAHVLSSATTANQNATDGGARMLMSTSHLMLLPSELIGAMELPPLLRTISPRRHRPRPRKYNRVYY
ncbi:hypothetical protein DYB26_009444 [Aphanomyces astaci]|uniref:Uncharacterized protein n=1 Tax=Aphanomyces astaci TaxID=112090 RepID=A0A3R6ZTC4_APHAT|nr:hypothetical protein DYB26_009444 [Aphanomyces astaci]